jgi:hypothetical protein
MHRISEDVDSGNTKTKFHVFKSLQIRWASRLQGRVMPVNQTTLLHIPEHEVTKAFKNFLRHETSQAAVFLLYAYVVLRTHKCNDV